MITPEQKLVLIKAITNYGTRSQLDMATEECAELIQAINKFKRICLGADELSVKNSLTYYGLCSEIADVIIMMEQLKLMLSEKAIQISIDRKIERLENNLKPQ